MAVFPDKTSVGVRLLEGTSVQVASRDPRPDADDMCVEVYCALCNTEQAQVALECTVHLSPHVNEHL